jgi:hypothetical protein
MLLWYVRQQTSNAVGLIRQQIKSSTYMQMKLNAILVLKKDSLLKIVNMQQVEALLNLI